MCPKPSANRFQFTQKSIDAIASEGVKRRYLDTVTPGFALLVTPGGAKTYYFYRGAKPRPIEIRIGQASTITLAAARAKATEYAGDFAAGRDPRQPRRRRQTFDEMGAWWMEYAQRSKKSWPFDQWLLDTYLAKWRNRHADTITRDDAESLHRHITTNHGAAAANRAMELARAIFARAYKKGIFDGRNPLDGLDWNKKVERDRRLNPTEIAPFFAAVDTEDEDIRHLVYLAILTAARQGDLLALHTDQVDRLGGLWRIPEPKNGTPQIVPLDDLAREIIDLRIAQHGPGWLFPAKSASGHRTEPRKGWERIIKRATETCPSLSDLRFHDLRRTKGSYMADTGASLHMIGRALGHKDAKSTRIYARFATDPIRAANDKAITQMFEHRRQGDELNRRRAAKT